MSEINWITPPENQGQIVIVSYAGADGTVYRQTFDQSDRTAEYHASRALVDDEGDYWNGAPANRRWRKVTEDAAISALVEW